MKCWAFVFALALMAVGCTTDDPATDGSDPAATTRTSTGDDPEGQSSGGTTIMVNPEWPDTYDYDFDGRPIGNPDSVTIALPEGVADEGDAQDAV